MAIKVNKNGEVVIEKVLKVTKELEELPVYEDCFNWMMRDYRSEFIIALTRRLETCEEAVVTAKEIHAINTSNIVYTSKEGYIRIYSFNAENTMTDLLTALKEGKLIRIGDMNKPRCIQLLIALSRFTPPE